MRIYKKDKNIATITYNKRKILLITQIEIDKLKEEKRFFNDIIKFNLEKILKEKTKVKYILICGMGYNIKFLTTDEKEKLNQWLTPILFGSFNHIDLDQIEKY